MIYSFNYCSFLKERSTHFNADSTVTTVKVAEIISGIKKKKEEEEESLWFNETQKCRHLFFFFNHRSR